MTSPLPQHLQEEQRALEAEIREAFKGVTREGGRSWSEAETVDDWGDESERAAARAKDTDTNWTQLADNADWDIGPGMGGFSLLDPIGFRYYLPAAMIRSIRTRGNAFSVIDFADILTASGLKIAKWEMLDDRQRRCVARFLRFMIDESPDSARWQRAYKSHWDRFAAPHSGQAVASDGVPRRS